MLYFNELRITSDGNSLIIDAGVDGSECFKNVKIDSIVIDTQDTYVPNGPSNNPVYVYKNQEDFSLTYALPEDCNCNPVQESDDYAYCLILNDKSLHNLRLVLSSSDISGGSLLNTLFFVYIIAAGEAISPCVTQTVKMGTVAHFYPYYLDMMKYIRELEVSCEVPKSFIAQTLRFKAFEYAIRVGNYPVAIKYWNKFFRDRPSNGRITNCSCYG